MTLPSGFRARVRADVRRVDGGRVLVGGSPLRAVRMSPAARALVDEGVVVVGDDASARVARLLLDGNLADPVLGPPVDAADLTVVVPVRDRADQLDRALGALVGLEVVVVDDASRDPAAVRAVARRHGARVVALTRNVGPAGARNAGLREVATPYVAFVDSDVTVSAPTLLALCAHFADPRVALVGPQVCGVARSPRPRWFERYDVRASSLALGPRPASVRPGAVVGWLPSACLVGRVAALGEGFSPEMRVGEDVDLVWRLVAADHVVRYDPALEAGHDARATVAGWLGRKFVYGSGGADLARRHGDAIAPARLAPVMALAGAGVLLRRRWSLLAALAFVVWGARDVRAAVPDLSGEPAEVAGLGIRGLGWALRQEAALLLRHWAPAALLLLPWSRTGRRVLGSAVVVDSVAALVDRPTTEIVGSLVARRADDLAYGAGLWTGALRARSARCLVPLLLGPRGRGAGLVRRPGATGSSSPTRSGR